MTVPGAVWLGSYVVPTHRLAERGCSVDELLGAGHELFIDDLAGTPPTDGWRVVVGQLSDPPIVMAAPSSSPRSNGWMVVVLGRPDGRWQASVEMDPRPIAPFVEPSVRWPQLSQMLGCRWNLLQVRPARGVATATTDEISMEFRAGRDGVHVGTLYDGRSTGQSAVCSEVGDHRLGVGPWITSLALRSGPSAAAQLDTLLRVLVGDLEWTLTGDDLTFVGAQDASVRAKRVHPH